MRIKKTNQGVYEIYLWNKSSEVPKGIENSCVVLNEKEMGELRELILDFED